MDFKYQKEKAESKFSTDQNNNHIKLNDYTESKKLAQLKETYQEKNILPNKEEIKRLTTKNEYFELKDSAVEKLAKYRELNDIREIIKKSPELGEKIAENSFNAIVHFNADMKVLAMNAYQLKLMV